MIIIKEKQKREMSNVALCVLGEQLVKTGEKTQLKKCDLKFLNIHFV